MGTEKLSLLRSGVSSSISLRATSSLWLPSGRVAGIVAADWLGMAGVGVGSSTLLALGAHVGAHGGWGIQGTPEEGVRIRAGPDSLEKSL